MGQNGHRRRWRGRAQPKRRLPGLLLAGVAPESAYEGELGSADTGAGEGGGQKSRQGQPQSSAYWAAAGEQYRKEAGAQDRTRSGPQGRTKPGPQGRTKPEIGRASCRERV